MKQQVLLLLTFFLALPALGNVPVSSVQDETYELDPQVMEEVEVVIDGLPARLKEVDKAVQQVQEQLEEKEKQEAQRKKEWVVWQNTLIGERDFLEEMPSFGVYNRDLVKGGAVLLKGAGTYYLFHKLYQNRIDHVFSTLSGNPQQALTLLEDLKKAEIADEQAHTEKRFFQRLFGKKTPQSNQAITGLKKEHKIIGYNPFKRVLAPGLVTLAVATYMANQVRKRLLVNDAWQSETWKRYAKVDGEIVELEKEPISIVPVAETAVGFFQNPLAIVKFPYHLISDYLGDSLGEFELGNKFKNFVFPRCPDKVWQALGPAQKVALVGIIIKERDRVYDRIWSSYLKKNREEAETILTAYQEAKKNCKNSNTAESAKKLEDAEAELMKFIKKGHSIRSWNPAIALKKWFSLTSPAWLAATEVAVVSVIGFIVLQKFLGKRNMEVNHE